ncbi:MAG: hypothetical protein R3C16_12775 [Hyphomonadaceae bacterium]
MAAAKVALVNDEPRFSWCHFNTIESPLLRAMRQSIRLGIEIFQTRKAKSALGALGSVPDIPTTTAKFRALSRS